MGGPGPSWARLLGPDKHRTSPSHPQSRQGLSHPSLLAHHPGPGQSHCHAVLEYLSYCKFKTQTCPGPLLQASSCSGTLILSSTMCGWSDLQPLSDIVSDSLILSEPKEQRFFFPCINWRYCTNVSALPCAAGSLHCCDCTTPPPRRAPGSQQVTCLHNSDFPNPVASESRFEYAVQPVTALTVCLWPLHS